MVKNGRLVSDLARRAAAANSSEYIRESAKTLIATPAIGPKTSAMYCYMTYRDWPASGLCRFAKDLAH